MAVERVADHQIAGKLANASYKPLWIMTTHRDGEFSGSMVVSALSLYRSQPVKVVVCVTKHDHTHDLVMASRVFALHVLRPDQLDLAVRFAYTSGREVDKFASLSYKIGATGCPVLTDCLGYMEFEVLADVDTPTHTVVVGEVRYAEAYLPLDDIGPGAGVNEEWFSKHAPPHPKSLAARVGTAA